MTDDGRTSWAEDPTAERLHVRMGRERVVIDGGDLRRLALTNDMSCLEQIYDAARRDVRASMSPLERPQPRVIRIGNRSALAHPLRPGCSQARNHLR